MFQVAGFAQLGLLCSEPFPLLSITPWVWQPLGVMARSSDSLWFIGKVGLCNGRIRSRGSGGGSEICGDLLLCVSGVKFGSVAMVFGYLDCLF